MYELGVGRLTLLDWDLLSSCFFVGNRILCYHYEIRFNFGRPSFSRPILMYSSRSVICHGHVMFCMVLYVGIDF
ncbi:hypothetical protein BDV24DRAFT_142382 [Aspergillus arachidicola]|uniref:Uncharacterized protein n=1 Tax=Aspergillus arachidicola TaxID=656916 RepID=A0A5N6XSU8_9EURO|nr:hypothetical protein BDV24DRAFT_142382 [Aspergillus arachidicola]